MARILALRPEMIHASANGWSALRYAVFAGHEHIAEALLALKPESIRDMSRLGESILQHAVPNCTFNFVIGLWLLNPQALHVADCHSRTPFHLAVFNHNEGLIDAFQGKLTFDEIVIAFVRENRGWEVRYRPVMERQCESLLLFLNRDVMGTVLEYLGFKRPQ